MANLTLCRVVKGAAALSRLASRCSVSSSEPSGGFLRKALVASPLLNRARSSFVASAATCQRYSGKALAETRSTFTPSSRRAMSTGGDHVRLWQIERVVAASFIVLLPACVILENAVTDLLFSALVVMHAHWGLEAVIVDYARPSVVGNVLPKVAFASLYLLSAVTLVGLLSLIYNGDGLGKTIKRMWSIGREHKAA